MRMGTPDPGAQMQAVIADLFDPGVAVALRDLAAPQPPLHPAERAAMARAAEVRRAEFAAGRAAARQAMVQLGGDPQAIPAGPDRAPIWPAGWRGTITHDDQFCAAAVTRGDLFLGLDLEPAQPLPADLLDEICLPAEQRAIAGPDQLTRARLIFCAKEAAYKAQYPLTGALFGFDRFEVTLGPAQGRFSVTFTAPTGGFAAGDVLHGRFAEHAGRFACAVTLDPGAQRKGG